MNSKELKFILHDGEGYRVEFKESIAGLPQVNYYWDNYVKATFMLEKKDSYLIDYPDRVGEKVGEKLTQNQRIILEKLQADPLLPAKKLAIYLGISQRKTEENLAKLKVKGYLQRIGSAKGGYWHVINSG